LVLHLHPDKLHSLDEEMRAAGADALHAVHNAKEEMKRRSQEACAEVPQQPVPDGNAIVLSKGSGSRKVEVRWKIPESSDPQRPVEKYEVWGAKYFSEAGDPFDWVLLASLPPLQTHFVLVEEAPTQQDVMWAADRIRRKTLPLSVNAVNGKGPSEALTFEMNWAGTDARNAAFPWLQGGSSVICPQCCQVSVRKGAWSRCGGCGFYVPTEHALILRCPTCQGEVLWSHAASQLSCTCCFKKFGGAAASANAKALGRGEFAQQQWKGAARPPTKPPPGLGSGRAGAGRSGGGRPW
jgi:hypothetical protein